MTNTIPEICSQWEQQDIKALAYILDLPEDKQSLEHIENKIKWACYATRWDRLKAKRRNIASKLDRSSSRSQNSDNQVRPPQYFELLERVLSKLKIGYKDATLADKEEFLCQAVIVRHWRICPLGNARRLLVRLLNCLK